MSYTSRGGHGYSENQRGRKSSKKRYSKALGNKMWAAGEATIKVRNAMRKKGFSDVAKDLDKAQKSVGDAIIRYVDDTK